MAVKHILADGTEVDDISGHVVKEKDARCVYDLIEQINAKKAGGKNEERKED